MYNHELVSRPSCATGQSYSLIHLQGFYMEPEPSTGMIKLVNEFAGYTNNQPWRPFPRNIAHSLPYSPFTSDPVTMSVPRSHALNPSDTIPTECAVAIESLVARCLPFLKGRQLIQKAMCWCTDTVDSNWLICRDPRWSTAEQSAKVIIASGDSGQTFKMFPVVGKQVADLIENKVSQYARQSETLKNKLISKLAPERQHLWRWRPNSPDVDGTGRAGEQPKDLKGVSGWKHDAFRSHL